MNRFVFYVLFVVSLLVCCLFAALKSQKSVSKEKEEMLEKLNVPVHLQVPVSFTCPADGSVDGVFSMYFWRKNAEAEGSLWGVQLSEKPEKYTAEAGAVTNLVHNSSMIPINCVCN